MSARGREPDANLRRLLRELAGEDAHGLLAEARIGARARARALLDELLAAAAKAKSNHAAPRAPDRAPAGSPTADPGRAAAGSPSSDPGSEGEAWWVYCVLRAQDAGVAIGLEGIEPASEVLPVAEADLAALVSRVPLSDYDDARLREHLEDIEWLERTARGHEAVLEGAQARATIVPLRLCTIYRDSAGVRRMLSENHDALADTLTRVDGCAEWGAKVFLEGVAAPPEGPEAGRAESGAEYLAGRRRQREAAHQVDELCARCAEAVHAEMGRLAREVRLNPVQAPQAHGRSGEMILNGVYLVDGEHVADLRAAAAELGERWRASGFAVELTGPWPPYNFVADATELMA
jgi:hypothetical protein